MIFTESTRCCPDLRRASACSSPPGLGSSRPRRESLALPTPPTDLPKSLSGRHRKPASKGPELWLPRALSHEVDHIVRHSALLQITTVPCSSRSSPRGFPRSSMRQPSPARPTRRTQAVSHNQECGCGKAQRSLPEAGFYNQVDVRRWRRSRRQRDDVRPIERMIQWQPAATPSPLQPQVVAGPAGGDDLPAARVEGAGMEVTPARPTPRSR
jgi:hypothetical protein